MPIQISRLKCLQTLTKFVVNKNIGFQIGELGKLPNLRGAILIAKLQYVINPTDALYAKLKAKRELKDLTLEWDADDIISQSERDVHNNLQPHTNLKRFCLNLPSLGQLPSLQNLGIVGFDEVVKVGPDFYGGSFSHLFNIWKSEILPSFPKGGLPSNLVLFRIDVSEKLFATRMDWGLKRLHSFTTLILSNLASDFQAVESFPSDFRAVESFPEENLLPTSLTTLFIGGFQNLRSLDNKGLQHLTSLQQLRIVNCPELKHMPKVGLPVSIYYLRIYSCPSFSKQCKEKKGKEWRKIAHFPFIHIDDDVVIRAKSSVDQI
ncbi:putative disease resistance protein RGA3 [Quercus robur]|uniref:putative disease resistance protein RGA3 n=1 Tax=Quercus robur TaxID=38942 RepID=UPI00216201F0|nr:putative disease resistance protein RGA3 [Quercus robur]